MAEMDKLSYALGLSMGNNFQRSGVRKLNADEFAAALKAVYGEGEMLMTYEEAKQVVNDYFTQLEEDTRLANKKACEVFLQENAKRPEVKVTESGLQYQIVKEGEGESPKATDTVKVHYTGCLIDGKVFDSSVQRGEPAVFGVNQVIPGWVEALQMMKPGAEWRLFIPSNLAYGSHGAGPLIGPDTALIFDVQLIEIVK